MSNPNSCSAAFGGSSASAIAQGAYGTAQILSGQDCVFTAVSNVPWIALSSGYYGSGNTALTYLVRPNLTANSRSGTIIIGSQTYTVTQGRIGRISIVDLQANSVSKMIPVPMDPGGIILAGNVYAYVFPAELGNFNNFYSVQVSTGILTSGMDTYYGLIPRLDVSGNYLYVSNQGLSKLDIRNGPATVISSDLSKTANSIWLSEDGARLLNSDGDALFTSSVPSQDLQPGGRLSGTTSVDWAANSRVQHQTAVLSDPYWASDSAQLQIYGDSGLQLQRQMTMPTITNGGTSYASHGKYVFWNAAASKLFVLTEADSTSESLSDFAEYTVDAPKALPACTFSISPSSLNVWYASDSQVNWLFNVTSNCTWVPIPMDNWVNVLLPITVTLTGNGQVSFTASQNSGAARSTSIVIGNQALQVNQAASTCTNSISYTGQTFTQAGGTGQVGLTIGAGCPWSTGGPFISGGTIRSFSMEGVACGIPPTALAYSLNIKAIPHGPLSYISVWPTGDQQPLVSTLNSNDGRTKANAAIVGGGAVTFYATNDTDLAVDIDGYFVDASSNTGLEFYPLTPCRLVDTRNANGPLGGPSINAFATSNTHLILDVNGYFAP